MILEPSSAAGTIPSSHPKTSIREATINDVEQIRSLGSHVFTITFGHSVQPHQLQAYLDEAYSISAVTSDIESPSKTMIIASTIPQNADHDPTSPSSSCRKEEEEKKEVVVAFALLTRGSHAHEPCVAHLERTVELQRLYVHPDFHGKGVARRLSEELERIARSEGLESMWLGVWEENPRARRAYEKMGFAKIGEHGFDVGGDLQTDWVMFKTL